MISFSRLYCSNNVRGVEKMEINNVLTYPLQIIYFYWIEPEVLKIIFFTNILNWTPKKLFYKLQMKSKHAKVIYFVHFRLQI